MSAMPTTVLRHLAFPTRVAALVCLRTGRVLAFVPAASPEGRRDASRHAGGTRPSAARSADQSTTPDEYISA